MAPAFEGPMLAADPDLLLFNATPFRPGRNSNGPVYMGGKAWMPFQYRHSSASTPVYGTDIGMFWRDDAGKWVLADSIAVTAESQVRGRVLLAYPDYFGNVYYVLQFVSAGITTLARFHFSTESFTSATLPSFGSNPEAGAYPPGAGNLGDLYEFRVIADGNYILVVEGTYSVEEWPSTTVQPVCLEYKAGAWIKHGRLCQDPKYLQVQGTFNQGVFRGTADDVMIADGARAGRIYFATTQHVIFTSTSQSYYHVYTELDPSVAPVAGTGSWRTVLDLPVATVRSPDLRLFEGFYANGMLLSPVRLDLAGETQTVNLRWVANLGGTATYGTILIDTSATYEEGLYGQLSLVQQPFGDRDEMTFVYSKTLDFEWLDFYYLKIDTTTIPPGVGTEELYIRRILLTEEDGAMPPPGEQEMYWTEGFTVGYKPGADPNFEMIVFGEGRGPDGQLSCGLPIYFGGEPTPEAPPVQGYSYLSHGRTLSFSSPGGPFSLLACQLTR